MLFGFGNLIRFSKNRWTYMYICSIAIIQLYTTRGERGTHTIFTMLTVPSDPKTRGTSRSPNWPRQASDLNSCFFSKSPRIPSPSLPGLMPFIPLSYFLSGVFIMTFVIVTSSVRARKHLHSMCALARALNRIVLSLTKPNDKI